MSRLLRSALCILSLAILNRATCSPQVSELSSSPSECNLDWPRGTTKNFYNKNGRYIPMNIIAARAQIYKDYAILAFPRFEPGVPFTLGVVPLKDKSLYGTSGLSPFPSSSIQKEGNCNALQSIVDLVLDPPDYLWILDVGTVDPHQNPDSRCPPKVAAIDIVTGKVVKAVDLSNLTSDASDLQHLAVDIALDGKVYLYISDAGTRAIIVCDVAANRGYRVMLPKAVALKRISRSGILYMALVRKSSESPVLYFTYSNSKRIYSIMATDLRSTGTAACSAVEVGVKWQKIVILGTNNDSAIFFRYKDKSDIYMWNTETRFIRENTFLVQKSNECRLPTQVLPGYDKSLWVLESNFMDNLNNTLGRSGVSSVALHPLVQSHEDL